MAPAWNTTKAPATKHLSRLHPAALALAVYASPRRLPGQDARLASGCWLGVTGWDWLPTGFERKVSRDASYIRSPFPGFAWRKSQNVPFCPIRKRC